MFTPERKGRNGRSFKMNVRKTKKRSKARSKSRVSKRGMYSHVSKVPKNVLQNPFSKTQKVVHKYVERDVSLDPAAGASAINVFSVNGLYDPNITGAGHQPHGFDEMNALYNRYNVINTQVRVIFSAQTASGNRYCVGVCQTPGTSLLTNTQYLEGTSAWDLLPSGSIAGETRTLYLAASPGQYFGIAHPMSEKDIQGTGSGNPTKQFYFHVFAMDEGTANPSAVTATVEIAYTAVWSEPKQLTVS